MERDVHVVENEIHRRTRTFMHRAPYGSQETFDIPERHRSGRRRGENRGKSFPVFAVHIAYNTNDDTTVKLINSHCPLSVDAMALLPRAPYTPGNTAGVSA